MKQIMVILITLLFLSGCSASADSGPKTYNNEKDAIINGLAEESLNESDILGEVTTDGTKFVFFKKDLSIGVANIANDNGKYTWFRGSQYTNIGKSSRVEWDTETRSGEKFWVIAGKLKTDEILIDTKEGSIQPEINKNEKIYFTVTPNK